MDSASPFAGILTGQPTLSRQLRLGTFAALDQRIATRFTGVVVVSEWRPDTPGPRPAPAEVSVCGGVARKP